MFEAASKAEQHAHADARSACFYARRVLELAVSWGLHARQSTEAAIQRRPQRPHHEPTFRAPVGDPLFTKARLV